MAAVLTLAGPWAEVRCLKLLAGFHDVADLLGQPDVAAEVSAVARA